MSAVIASEDTLTRPAADRSDALPQALRDARREGEQAGLPFAGSLPPKAAWDLVQAGRAVLVDVRTTEERKFVGHVPGTVHVAWATGTSMTRNPRFVKELESKVTKADAVLFLCRSGKRSAEAAAAATKAGFLLAFNVAEGFEGDLDDNRQRGRLNGWRSHGLPWVQD